MKQFNQMHPENAVADVKSHAAHRALIGNLPFPRLLSSWGFVALLLIISAIFIPNLVHPEGINSILMLTSMMAVASLAQSFVVLVGGIDLSIPMVATYAGIGLTWFTVGPAGPLNSALAWVVPGLLLFGCLIGIINGLGVVFFRVHPIVMTMGMSGILQGSIILLTNGHPNGHAPSAIVWFANGTIGGVFVSVIFMVLLAIVVGLLLSYSSFGRKLYAVGSNRKAAMLSGVRVRFYEVLAYVLSGLLSAVLGILIAGFVGYSYYTMADEYLLVSLAAVAVGGAQMLGGKGHVIGTLGGAIMLSYLSVMLTAFLIPAGVRDMIYGIMILIAIIGIREKGPRS